MGIRTVICAALLGTLGVNTAYADGVSGEVSVAHNAGDISFKGNTYAEGRTVGAFTNSTLQLSDTFSLYGRGYLNYGNYTILDRDATETRLNLDTSFGAQFHIDEASSCNVYVFGGVDYRKRSEKLLFENTPGHLKRKGTGAQMGVRITSKYLDGMLAMSELFGTLTTSFDIDRSIRERKYVLALNSRYKNISLPASIEYSRWAITQIPRNRENHTLHIIIQPRIQVSNNFGLFLNYEREQVLNGSDELNTTHKGFGMYGIF